MLIAVVFLSLLTLCNAQCRQLGCDAAGRFTQDGFKFVMLNGNRSVAWKSEIFNTAHLNPQNVNFGCVTDDKLVVCIRNVEGNSRHLYLNANDGSEVVVTCEGVDNSGAALITTMGGVLSVNKTHIGVVNPIENECHVQKHGHMLMKNSLSPVYVEQADVYLVPGNSTDLIMIWKLDKSGQLVKLADYSFPAMKSQTNCPWKQITELAISGNRIYTFSAAKVQSSGMDSVSYGILAFDILADKPWIKPVWILLDENKYSEIPIETDERLNVPKNINCEVFDDATLPNFQPMDLAAQMLATPDKYIVLNYILSLQVFQDQGSKAERIMSNFWGDHFITFVGSPARDNSSVWMSGWSYWPMYGDLLLSLAYIPPYDPNVNVKGLSFLDYLNATSMNITSRLTTFDQPISGDKIIVFSAEHGNTDADRTRSIMASRTPFIASNSQPIWNFPLPDDLESAEVKGQIIGADGNLICYVTDGTQGYILAIN